MNGKERQKIATFEKACRSLQEALSKPVEEPRDLAGIIQNFEFTYETGWKALQAWLKKQGHTADTAREAFVEGYRVGAIGEEATWVRMIEDRNLTTHTYNEELAREMKKRIERSYLPAFLSLLQGLRGK